MMRYAWIALSIFSVSTAHAQLQVVDFSPKTITFDESIGWDDGIPDNDVIRAPLQANSLRIVEPGHWDWAPGNPNGWGLASGAWSYKWQSVDSAFGQFADGNGRIETFQTNGADLSSFGLGTGWGVQFTPNSWDDKSLTLRARNMTGGTVSLWNL
ncbi:MAG: hypothetical protein SNJ61_12230, partial [Fimbriimonadaceae bacterium]